MRIEHEVLRTSHAVERAFQSGRYVYFRALRPWTGGWVRIGNKGKAYFKNLLMFGEVRARA